MPERKPGNRILNQTISRRDLLKGAIVLAGGAFLLKLVVAELKNFSKNRVIYEGTRRFNFL